MTHGVEHVATVAALLVAGMGVAYWLLVPWAVLVHELGHAAVVLLLTGGRPTVHIGADPDRSLSVGRLTVRIDPRAWRQNWYGFCRYGETPDGRRSRAALSLAGPAASGLVLAVTALALPGVDGLAFYTLVGLAWWTAVQFVATAIPVTYPGWYGHYAGLDSDGKQALQALRGER